MRLPLNIFVPHCSDLLTDHLPHGDGLVAHGFITSLARRGHRLHVAAQRVDLREPLPANVTVHEISPRAFPPLLSRLDYMLRVRLLLGRLNKEYCFDLVHQLNPVFTGMSLSLTGCGLPLVLGTYVARWPDDPETISSKGKWFTQLLPHVRSVICDMQQRQAGGLLLSKTAGRHRKRLKTAFTSCPMVWIRICFRPRRTGTHRNVCKPNSKIRRYSFSRTF